jgi:hypothetical protein
MRHSVRQARGAVDELGCEGAVDKGWGGRGTARGGPCGRCGSLCRCPDPDSPPGARRGSGGRASGRRSAPDAERLVSPRPLDGKWRGSRAGGWQRRHPVPGGAEGWTGPRGVGVSHGGAFQRTGGIRTTTGGRCWSGAERAGKSVRERTRGCRRLFGRGATGVVTWGEGASHPVLGCGTPGLEG